MTGPSGGENTEAEIETVKESCSNFRKFLDDIDKAGFENIAEAAKLDIIDIKDRFEKLGISKVKVENGEKSNKEKKDSIKNFESNSNKLEDQSDSTDYKNYKDYKKKYYKFGAIPRNKPNDFTETDGDSDEPQSLTDSSSNPSDLEIPLPKRKRNKKKKSDPRTYKSSTQDQMMKLVGT